MMSSFTKQEISRISCPFSRDRERESLLLVDEKIGTKKASKARNIEQREIG